MDLEPVEFWRRNVRFDKNCTTEKKTPENRRDRNETADIFPAAGEEGDECGRSERQQQNEPRQQSIGGEGHGITRESRETGRIGQKATSAKSVLGLIR